MLSFDNVGGTIKQELYHELDNNAVTQFINRVLSDMESLLDSRQLLILNDTLQTVTQQCSISSDEELYFDMDHNEFNESLLSKFVEAKRLVGLSERTITTYLQYIRTVFKYLDKGADSVTVDDIRDFLDYMLNVRGNGYVSLDNYRRILSTFYKWCVSNGLLYKNPVLKLDSIKHERRVKQAFSNEEILLLRENCLNLRDRAIFELLLSSGMRVGELVLLNVKDLDMTNCSCVVTGKGNKQRTVYFNENARLHIQRYIDSRGDTNPALFVNLNHNARRLGIGGVEGAMSNLGKRAGVNKVHPHRFRRTFATKLLNKGVHIEQIRELLGHAEIQTTQLYVVQDTDEIQYNHKRYVN